MLAMEPVNGWWLKPTNPTAPGPLPSPTGLITNLELDHTDHYPNLDALVATMRRFSGNCSSVLANQDCPVLSSS